MATAGILTIRSANTQEQDVNSTKNENSKANTTKGENGFAIVTSGLALMNPLMIFIKIIKLR